jgi:hypothetical protein
MQTRRRRRGGFGTFHRGHHRARARVVRTAIASLKAHLADGDPGAWRAALRALEHYIGRPGETLEDAIPVDLDPLGVASMTQAQRAALIRRVFDDHPNLAELLPPHAQELIGRVAPLGGLPE